jgi:hypothetical protein
VEHVCGAHICTPILWKAIGALTARGFKSTMADPWHSGSELTCSAAGPISMM